MIAARFLYKGGNQHPGNLVMDAGILRAGKQQGDVTAVGRSHFARHLHRW